MSVSRFNPPGLSTIGYRRGIQPEIFERMLRQIYLEALPGSDGAPVRPLEALTTRDTGDPAIALLDAWAVVADVLGFYQERIANEGFFRTLTSRRSALELRRTFGSELRAGAAAAAWLAFTVEADPGAVVNLPPGIAVQSVPVGDAAAQTFETIEEVDARPEWNALAVDVTRTPEIHLFQVPPVFTLKVQGTDTRLKPGSLILLAATRTAAGSRRIEPAPDPQPALIAITAVTPDDAEGSTELEPNPGPQPSRPDVFALREKAALFGYNAQNWRDLPPERKWVQANVFPLSISPVPEPAGLRLPLEALAFSANGWLFGATDGAGVFRTRVTGLTPGRSPATEDGSRHWQPCNTGLANLSVFSLFADDRGQIFAGCSDGMIFRSTDDGDSWKLLSSGALRQVTLTKEVPTDHEGKPESDKEPVVNPDKTVEVFVGTGLPVECVRALTGFAYPDGTRHLYAANTSGIFHSSDGGESWTTLEKREEGGSVVNCLLAVTQGFIATLLVGASDGPRGILLVSSTGTPGPAFTSHIPGAPSIYQEPVLSIVGHADPTRFTFLTASAIVSGVIFSPGRPQIRQAKLRRLVNIGDVVFAGSTIGGFGDEWPDFDLSSDSLDLDSEYQSIAAGGSVVLRSSGGAVCLEVREAVSVVKKQFGLSAKVTRLILRNAADLRAFDRREADVFIGIEHLPAFSPPALTRRAFAGLEIPIAGDVPPLPAGRRVIVRGLSFDAEDPVTEIVTVAGMAVGGDGRMQITLTDPLTRPCDAATVSVLANVALATHGETVNDEILGSGDGSIANQTFSLEKSPLTQVRAPGAQGVRSALSIRVNGVLWEEAPYLFGAGPRDRVYTVRIDNQGDASITFGDGENGARLPSGTDNVVATYRTGLGPEGNVAANTLTLLQAGPVGLIEVFNPQAAEGGAAPDDLEEARRSIPRGVLTLGRIVSLNDFENAALSLPGIGKAEVQNFVTDSGPLIYLTIAGTNGEQVPEDSLLATAVVEALDRQRSPAVQLRIGTFQPVLFGVDLRLYRDPDALSAQVEDDVRQALVTAFAFAQRDFGQPVSASEVLGLAQAVPGVVGVELKSFLMDAILPPGELLWALPAAWDASKGTVTPAEMLLLDPSRVSIEVIAA